MKTDISQFQSQKAELDAKYDQLSNKTSMFIEDLKRYIQTAGVNPNTEPNVNDPLYAKLNGGWNEISKIIRDYQTFNKNLSSRIKYYSAANDHKKLLAQVATTSINIEDAKKELAKKRNDLDISKSRELSINTAKTSHSFLQGFSGYIGFLNPLKPTTVPLLLGLAFFILFCSGLILKDFFTTSAEVASQYFSLNEIFQYLNTGNSRFILLGIFLTFIIYAIGLYVYFYKMN